MHIPILLKESIDSLNLKEGDMVVDCTTNRGGHSLEISKRIGKSGNLICLDLDGQALKEAQVFLKSELKDNSPNIFFINENFRNIKKVLKDLKFEKIDGLMADLGVSSQEIDESGRGFTFQKNEPLYMTLQDKISEDALTAEKIVNTWDEENLADIIYYYGDERFAKRIAKNICLERKNKEIKSTFDLVEIIKKSVPEKYKHQKIHFATKTFQALRITVNDELRAEEELVQALPEILKENKRASFLTFHSGEDRVLKKSINLLKDELRFIKFENKKNFLEPERKEIFENPRSRSAKLRVVEKKYAN
ncbi:MAG TPA: 16S rRNA (cytosine(1402)-N(4))-methyltransferase RsmH [Candidatus Paceibacterota bacterium]|nr:16S rRNA (cytosine(1402)-N(4))-methyltransferase RsmH [Candidatus Paceibacterota bacterium]HQB57053.1 16S rRNA (cytosine(1402)-N(4))-methyltransferase RsmH [Candidatus Paceibacterota bacterium]